MNYFKKIINYFSKILSNYKEYISLFELNKFTKAYLSSFIYLNSFNYKLENTILSKTIYNYYNSDIYSKKSKVMIIASNKLKLVTFIN